MSHRKDYTAPCMYAIGTDETADLLAGSTTGMPQETTDGLYYDGPAGSFGEDEEVASRQGHAWANE